MLRRKPATTLVAGALVLLAGAAGLRGQDARAGNLPLTHAPRPTTRAITAGDLMTRLYVFAADSMLGRQTGTAGNVKATNYLAAEARRIGLEPAGAGGGYFQEVPLVFVAPDPRGRLTLAGAALTPGRDFVLLPGVPFLPFSSSFALPTTPAIYGGIVGDTTRTLRPEQAAGRVVVLAPPMVDGRPSSRFMSEPPPRGSLAGAAVLAVAALDLVPAGMLRDFGRRLAVAGSIGAPRGLPGAVLLGSAAAEQIFGKPLGRLEVGDTGAVLGGALRWIEEPLPYPARNVVAILPGRDPRLARQYVALMAHSDHLGSGVPMLHDSLAAFDRVMYPAGSARVDAIPTPEQRARIDALGDSLRRLWPERRDSIYNGADDDGSGSVALLEIAEYLAAGPRPKRSVLFVWHAAEEMGVFGSRWFTDHPTVPRDSIVAAMNLDMIGRGEPGAAGDAGVRGDVGVVGRDRLSRELGRIVAARARRDRVALDLRFDAPGQPHEPYCEDDHYNYARFGIPVAYFFTGKHADYHQLTDEPQYIDYPHLARLTGYIADLGADLANLDHRPLVDGADSTGRCQ